MTPILGRRNPSLIAIRILYVLICAWVIAAFVSPWASIPNLVERHLIVTYCVVLVATQVVLLLDVLIAKKDRKSVV